MVSTSGSSGIPVYIPARRFPIPAASCRFTRHEGGVALRQRVPTVRSQRPNPEVRPFEFCGQLRRIVEPHAMHLVVPPVVPPPCETHDPPLHRTPLESSSRSESTAQSSPTLKPFALVQAAPGPDPARRRLRHRRGRARRERAGTGDPAPLLVLRVEEVVETSLTP